MRELVESFRTRVIARFGFLILLNWTRINSDAHVKESDSAHVSVCVCVCTRVHMCAVCACVVWLRVFSKRLLGLRLFDGCVLVRRVLLVRMCYYSRRACSRVEPIV